MYVVQHNVLWRISKVQWKNFLKYAKVIGSVPPISSFASKVMQEDIPVLSADDTVSAIDDEFILLEEPEIDRHYKRWKLRGIHSLQ